MTGDRIWVVPGAPHETRVDPDSERAVLTAPTALTGVLLVRLSTRWLRRTGGQLDVPVLGIDDVPVSAGFGVVTVRLPPGRYLVGVQNRWDEGLIPVTIRGGQTTALTYRPLGKTAERGLFGPPDEVDAEHRRRSRVSFTVLAACYGVAALLCAGPLAFGTQASCDRGGCVEASDPLRGLGLWIALTAIVAVFAGLLAWHMRPRRRPYFQPELDKRSRSARPPEPVAADGLPPGSVALLDARSADQPDLAAGTGAIRLVAHLSRRCGEADDGRRSVHHGLDVVWTPAPKVRIDGRTVPAGWGNWWYALPAGRHRIEVDPPDHPASGEAESGTRGATVSIVAGRVFHIGCLAGVRYRYDPRTGRLADDRPEVTMHVGGNEK